MARPTRIDQGVIQISGVSPEIMRKFLRYEAEHGLSHIEAFTRAVEALLAAEESTE